jgi:hypothetical protein
MVVLIGLFGSFAPITTPLLPMKAIVAVCKSNPLHFFKEPSVGVSLINLILVTACVEIAANDGRQPTQRFLQYSQQLAKIRLLVLPGTHVGAKDRKRRVEAADIRCRDVPP